MGLVGQKKDIHNNVMNKKKYKLHQILELLKLSLEINDNEILRATVESIIEMLEDEVI